MANAKFFKCKYCGNVIEKLHVGRGEIDCCGADMQELIPNTVDAGREKHIPVVEINDGIVKVRVGSIDHPMVPLPIKRPETLDFFKVFRFIFKVDATGFEPATSASRTQRSTKLSHASLQSDIILTRFVIKVKLFVLIIHPRIIENMISNDPVRYPCKL